MYIQASTRQATDKKKILTSPNPDVLAYSHLVYKNVAAKRNVLSSFEIRLK